MTISLSENNASIVLSDISSVRFYFIFYILLIAVSLALPAILYQWFNNSNENKIIILILFIFMQCITWMIIFLTGKFTRSMYIDKISRMIQLRSDIPLFSYLIVRSNFSYEDVKKIILTKNILRGAHAWFLMMILQNNRPIKFFRMDTKPEDIEPVLKRINNEINDIHE